MDPRARRFALREHLSTARAALDRGDRTAALAALDAALTLDPEYLAAQAMKDQVERSLFARGDVPPAPMPQPRPVSGPDNPQTPSAGPSPKPREPLVSAEGWARFETRARSRRAEKRGAAARLLIARGRFAEARDAIEEIRQIDPAHPDLISLSIELDAAEHMQPSSWRVGPAVAAAVVFGALLLGARYLEVPGDVPAAPAAATANVTPAPEPAAATMPEAAVSDRAETTGAAAPPSIEAPAPPAVDSREVASTAPAAAPVATTFVAPRREASDTVAPSVETRQTPVETRTITSPVRTADATDIRTPAPIAPQPEPAPALLPPPAPAVTPATLPGAVSAAAPPLEASTARLTAREPAAVVAGGTAVAVAPEEDRVRRTLQLYQQAYETLDAQSAVAVWPRVDSVALQRAFDGLQSQRLTFNECQVQVRGSYGSAVCRGTARYVPKIGSREPRVEPRTWTFALRKAGEDWQIDSARAER